MLIFLPKPNVLGQWESLEKSQRICKNHCINRIKMLNLPLNSLLMFLAPGVVTTKKNLIRPKHFFNQNISHFLGSWQPGRRRQCHDGHRRRRPWPTDSKFSLMYTVAILLVSWNEQSLFLILIRPGEEENFTMCRDVLCSYQRLSGKSAMIDGGKSSSRNLSSCPKNDKKPSDSQVRRRKAENVKNSSTQNRFLLIMG